MSEPVKDILRGDSLKGASNAVTKGLSCRFFPARGDLRKLLRNAK